MTLKEWAALQDHKLMQHPMNGQYYIADTNLKERSLAWYLEDYRVSSVSGGTIWFFPKTSLEREID